MKEKTRRVAKPDLKTLVSMLMMVKHVEGDEQDRHIPEFTMKELMIAIDNVKKGKSVDSKGINSRRSQRELTKKQPK